MDRREYELSQLRKMRDLITERDRREKEYDAVLSRQRESVKNAERSYPMRKTYPVDRAQRVKKEIEVQLYDKKERKKSILAFLRVFAAILFICCMVAAKLNPENGVFYMQGGAVGIAVVMVSLHIAHGKVSNKSLVWSEADLARLRDAEKRDAENARLMAEEEAKNEKLRAEAVKKAEESFYAARKQAFDRWNASIKEIKAMDLLGPDEQNLSTVEQLIKIMESHRADTLPEALRIYDEQQARRSAAAIALAEANMRQLEEKWRRQEQFERDMAEAAHRSKMEKLAQDQVDEQERKRKADEYYRRYGTPL